MSVVYNITIELSDYRFFITEDAQVLDPVYGISVYNYRKLVNPSCLLYYRVSSRDVFVELNRSVVHLLPLNHQNSFRGEIFFTQHLIAINYPVSDEYTVYLLNEELVPNKLIIVPIYTSVPINIVFNVNNPVPIDFTFSYPVMLFKFDTKITFIK